MKRFLKKYYSVVLWILIAAIFIWFIASFLDTNFHNSASSAYGQYAKWNLFRILFL